MSPRLSILGGAALLLSSGSMPAAPVFQNDGQGEYEIRKAFVPGAEPPPPPKPVWTNPLPAPAYHPLHDDVCDHLRSQSPKLVPLPLIHQAVIAGDEEWMRALLACGLSPDERTEAGDTPLCAAVRLGHLDCGRTLLLAGADPNLPGAGGQPPLALASLRRPVEMINTLLAAGARPDCAFSVPADAALLDQIPIKDLRNHLSGDPGVTPLMACAARGDVDGVVALLGSGAKTFTTTRKYRHTALDFAATQQFIFLMRVLLGRAPNEEPEVLITVDLSSQHATLSKNGKVMERTSVSTGREGYSTPAGRYVITDKHPLHKSTLYHVDMPWFMRLNSSAIGLHAGYVTGRPASHGCIRLPDSVARRFYSLTKVGDEVQIVR